MKYVFEYEETLMRKITVDADSLTTALTRLTEMIENAEIVLSADDFLTARILMPLDLNKYNIDIEKDAQSVPNKEDYAVVLEEW
jgi:hypothetical protein